MENNEEEQLDNTAHIKDLFNRIAAENEDKLSAMMGWHIYNDYDLLRIRHMLELIGIRGKRLLIAGTGIGRDIPLYKELGFEIAGVDLAEENIKICKLNHPELNLQVADIKDLKMFEDNSFDCIICLHVLTHVASDEHAKKAIQEFERISTDRVIIGGAMERNSPATLGGKLRLVIEYERMFEHKVFEKEFIDWSIYSQVEFATKVGAIHRVSYLIMKTKE